jgi:hypothetical protein
MDVKEMAKMGGEARARAMTPAARRKVASLAGKASARARKLKAEKKKATHSLPK